MAKSSSYTAKQANAQGYINYSDEEHAIWHDLMIRQLEPVKKYTCAEYQQALSKLELSTHRIPQCHEISENLLAATGWQVVPVPALISFEKFFSLLAKRKFPAASFIRSREEMDYLQEPDIFHEIFGHTPLLLDPRFAEFTHTLGKLGLKTEKENYSWLARLYWFTIEFGLIQTPSGIRAYGAGIASSHSELPYSVKSAAPIRQPFELMQLLRTPYRIDIHQPIYFVLDSFDTLFELTRQDLLATIKQARCAGLFDSHPAACTG